MPLDLGWFLLSNRIKKAAKLGGYNLKKKNKSHRKDDIFLCNPKIFIKKMSKFFKKIK